MCRGTQGTLEELRRSQDAEGHVKDRDGVWGDGGGGSEAGRHKEAGGGGPWC